MLVPVEWLRDYTKVDVSIDEFCERMIMSGSNLETATYFGEDFEKVVVGKVMEKKQHPDADRLSVCQVDVGEKELVQIVCGAPNVEEGNKVAVALHKSRIPGPIHGQPRKDGGVQITKGMLRGIESFGMICSATELGFSDKVVPSMDKEGIWRLPEEAQVGTPFEEAMGIKTQVIDFEITPNRPDCLAMVGMAREAAATFHEELTYPSTEVKEEAEEETKDVVKVVIEESGACRRYIARGVTDVKIEPSPWWIQKRLMLAGMRPINNIVDITNFVMLEYGHPLHAFDIRQIEGGKIVVGFASDKEEFVTLDEKKRVLDEETLMIKDGEKSIGIAGIMGGNNSDIVEDTKTILIEAANFNGDGIRRTSKVLGLRTEASARFEKGIDPNLSEEAINRACHLIEAVGGGKVLKGMVDEYPNRVAPWSVQVRPSRINKVLGTNLAKEVMVQILEELENQVEDQGEVLKVTPPTLRLDLVAEEDFVEEVVRMYGYDNLPMTLPRGNKESTMSKGEKLRRQGRNLLCAMGADEIQTYSFVSPSDVDKIQMGEDTWERNFVEILNPLGEENSVMRTVLTPAMMETLARNYSRNVENVMAFELGLTYSKNLMEEEGLPDEPHSLVIGMYGKNQSFFTLKGVVEELLQNLGVKDIAFEAEKEYGAYHPGRCARIMVKGQPPQTGQMEELLNKTSGKIEGDEEELSLLRDMLTMMAENFTGAPVELGIMGEIHPTVLKNYGMDIPCYCCEIMFDTVCDFVDDEILYKPLPKFPGITRDVALVVDEKVSVGEIEETIKAVGTDLLEKVKLFDIYRSKQVGEGKKSLAFNLIYRDREKTLTDEEVVAVNDKVLMELKEKYNATLREM